MSVVNKRWDGQTITPKHDSIQYDLGQNGIMHGCAITHLGTNILRIAEGYIVICGRLIEVDQTDINCEVSASGMLEGQLIIRLNLGATESVEILSEAAASLTELTQDDDANYDNGIYEIQLARYNVNETTISNLEVTAPTVQKLGDKVDELSKIITALESTINKPEFRDITADFDNGTFSANPEKYHAGNYIKKGNYLIMLADYDSYYGGYDSYATLSRHHWNAMVFGCGTHNINNSNTTNGGYNGSSMHTWLKDTILPALKSAFGSTHFISHQKLLSNGSGGWEWQTDQFISLPSEAQIYGKCPCSYQGWGTGEANKHLELFKYNSFMEIFNKGDELIGATTFKNSHAWLRDVSANSVSTRFCNAHCNGVAYNNDASNVYGAFPLVNLV